MCVKGKERARVGESVCTHDRFDTAVDALTLPIALDRRKSDGAMQNLPYGHSRRD